MISLPKIKGGDFLPTINKAIKEGRHVDYLHQYLKDFERYKKFFLEEGLTRDQPSEEIYLFRAEYLKSSPFWRKPAWRKVEIFGSQDFELLADEIIYSMGWNNDHLHCFHIPDPSLKSMPYQTSPFVFFCDCEEWDDDPHPTYKTNQIKICQVNYQKFPKLYFEFDFGDGHSFYVTYLGRRKKNKSEKTESFPHTVDKKGDGPKQYPRYK